MVLQTEDRPNRPELTPRRLPRVQSSLNHLQREPRRYHHDALDVTYEEARRVIEHQLDSVSDIDNKAAHTLRVLFVLFGLLITASSLLVNTLLRRPATELAAAKQFVNTFTAGGVASLLLSLFVAIWTYNETRTRSGLSPSAISSLSQDDSRERRFRQLFSQFPKWMVHNEVAIRRDSTLLFTSHFTMFIGIVSLIAGIVTELPLDLGTYVVRTPFPISHWLLLLGVFTFGLGLLSRRHTRWSRFLVGWTTQVNRATALRFCGLVLVFLGLALAFLG